MNLDDQKATSSRFPERPDATSTSPDACENGKIRLEFKATDFIVYPAHGVGQILSIEEQIVAGMRKPSDLSSVQGVKQILERTSPERPRQLVPAC